MQTKPEFHLKKILVPVDFTDCTSEAVMYAVPFARQFGAELILLHVVQPAYAAVSEMSATTAISERPEDARARLEALRKKVPAEVTSRIVLSNGSAMHEILRVANEEAVSLIVLGTHGRSGLARLLMGSTAEEVSRHAACPILLVRPQEREFVTPIAKTKPARQSPPRTRSLRARVPAVRARSGTRNAKRHAQ